VNTSPDQTRCLDAVAAIEWVRASSLAAQDRAALSAIVTGFPSASFFRHDAATLAAFEAREQIALPAWFRDLALTLGGFTIGAGAFMDVRFDRFDDDETYEYKDSEWWGLGAWGLNNDEDSRALVLDRCRLLPIGGIWNDDDFLAISRDDPNNRAIYRFYRQDLWDNEYDGTPASRSVHRAFESYASMLDSIGAVRPAGPGHGHDGPVIARGR
jgi:hypothetical protein